MKDRYERLRSIPDYIDGCGRSAYLRPEHPYLGQIAAANRDYADDLRALLSERDELVAAGLEDAAKMMRALETIVRGRPGWREAAAKALSALRACAASAKQGQGLPEQGTGRLVNQETPTLNPGPSQHE